MHKRVKSGIQISQEIAEFFEASCPYIFRGEPYSNVVATHNDILHGRGNKTPDELISELMLLEEEHIPKVIAICNDIRDFTTQKQMLSSPSPYRKSSSRQYKYGTFAIGSEKPLKIINQRIYDSAFKAGFPPNFFRESFFDGVVFYCIPVKTDFSFSRFSNCRFIVCGISNARFDGTSFDSCQFHTAEMRHATFFASTLTHTHFRDSTLSLVSFQKARLKSCSTCDSVMDRVGFLNAVLDGCSYNRITVTDTEHLETASITMGGATNEECDRNRVSVLNALGVAAP